MAQRKRAALPEPGPSLAEQFEHQERAGLLASAWRKLAEGKRLGDLSAPEKRALATDDAKQRRQYGVQFLHAMPKADYLELFGGSSKVNIEWRDQHGFPWPVEKSERVDVSAVMRWYRQQFVEGVPAVAAGDAEDVLLQGASKAIKDEFVRERIREKRITNQQKAIELEAKKASYMPTELIVEAHNELAERIRKTRERLVRHFDGNSRDRIELAFDGLIEDYVRDIEERFGNPDETNGG